MSITQLNEKFAISKQLKFSNGNGNLPVATITNQFGICIVSLHGAQVLNYQPKDNKEVLWLSEKSFFEETKAIRGGIPVCFPWFGPHPTDSLLPQHGFARLLSWDVAETSSLESGATQIRLQLHHSDATKVLWPHAFSAGITITLGAKLEVKFTVLNTDDTDFTFSDALHSYFNVSDISNISIDGLGRALYKDASSDELKEQEELLLVIAKEEDRRYQNHTADCIIYDKVFSRKTRIAKTGSKTTVVWNPGAEKAKAMKDVDEGGYKQFVCIEAANAFNDTIKLQPGKEFILSTTISI